MSIFEEIVSGWGNYMFKSPKIEEKAKERLKICLECESLTRIQSCNLCGCFMPAKVRSPLSSCPIKKWGKMELNK